MKLQLFPINKKSKAKPKTKKKICNKNPTDHFTQFSTKKIIACLMSIVFFLFVLIFVDRKKKLLKCH